MKRRVLNLGTNYEKAVVLNGSTQYLTSASADFDITDVVTIGTWIKFAASGQTFAVIMGNSGYRLEIASGGDRPAFAVPGQFGTSAGIKPILGDLKWHFIVGMYNKVNSIIYGDGALLLTEAHSNNIASGSGSFTVGAKSDFSAKINAQMKYAFVCNQALTSTQVQELFGIGPTKDMASYLSGLSLKSLWALNNDYTDLSGRGNTLTATGSPTFGNVSGSDFGRGARTVL